jgi:dihydroorotase-like cyclic amidohydrolase
VLRGGTVCTASQRAHADVGIVDGTIVQLGGDMQAEREMDATSQPYLAFATIEGRCVS